MPNYTTGNHVKAQTMLMGKFASNEMRYRDPVVLKEFLRNRDIMVPSHQEVRTREDRAVEVNYFARTSRALGTARVHNGTFNKGDSSTLTPVWSTKSDGFKYSAKQADNSVFALEQQLMNEYSNMSLNFAKGLETAASTYLFNNRSGVNAYARQGTFNGTQDCFEITETSEGSRGLQIAKSAMGGNDDNGPYVCFCDSVAYDKFEKQAFQGAGNDEDLSFNFQGVRFVKSFDLDTLFLGLGSPYSDGAWIMVPEGMIAALDWIPKQNREGYSDKEGEYSTWIDPITGLSIGMFWYSARYDGSATGDNDNGYTQDIKYENQGAIDIAFEHAPSTVANDSPIKAFAYV